MRLHLPAPLGALLACAFTLHTLAAAAQNTAPAAKPAQPSAGEMRKMMDASMGAMVPIMGRMREVMIETQFRIAEEPETAERIAKFKKNLYDSLLKVGFTQAQAMEITVSTAMPSVGVMGK